MEKITVLIALGPNDIHIPCMVCKTKDDAINHLSKLFNIKWELDVEYWLKEVYHYDDRKVFSHTTFQIITYENGKYHPIGIEVNENMLFISYYGGCGECNGLRLEEIDFAVPFVNFNLD